MFCNCDREAHGANYCLCDKPSLNVSIDGTVLTAYKSEYRSLLAIILLKIQRVILWTCLDTASGRNFRSREAIKKLSRKPKRHETRPFFPINGVQKESMPIFEVRRNWIELDWLNWIDLDWLDWSPFVYKGRGGGEAFIQ